MTKDYGYLTLEVIYELSIVFEIRIIKIVEL